MPSKNPLRRLVEKLLELKLVTRKQVKECLPKSGSAEGAMLHLLKEMQMRSYLTPFQVERIKNLDYDELVLGGNKLLYENAAGSFARVFRAARIEDGKVIALKLLRNRWSSDPETVSLFRREAEIGRTLKHPNIVPIYELGSDGNNHFFTMEFIVGGSLKDFLKIRGQLEPVEACRYIIDMARGLEYALSLGYTHRDLKTSNVLISADGDARLIDFGLATEEENTRKVNGESLQQAIEYTTLEKGTGAPRNDPRSDLFFLGGIFYELLSGKPPYAPTKSREERKQLVRYRNVRPLSQCLRECPQSVTEIVDRLMAIDPDSRYSSPTDLLEAILPVYRQLLRENREQEGSEDSQERMPGNDTVQEEKTILFVEKRAREQDWIRNYFSARGYRVLVLSNPERAITRLTDDPPDCFVMIEEGIGDNAFELFEQAIQIAETNDSKVVFLQSEKTMESVFDFEDRIDIAMLSQPISLREIRLSIQNLIDGKSKNSDVETKDLEDSEV